MPPIAGWVCFVRTVRAARPANEGKATRDRFAGGLPKRPSQSYSGLVPDDVGGRPFPDGDDHGDADEEFASVVFDEDFVRAALFHEPSAHERMLAATRTEARLVRFNEPSEPPAELLGAEDTGQRDAEYDELYAQRRPYRGHHTRWHRSVAWLLAVVMGIGVVALAFAAVYRGAGGARQPSVPPASPAGRVGAPSVAPSATSIPPVAASPARR